MFIIIFYFTALFFMEKMQRYNIVLAMSMVYFRILSMTLQSWSERQHSIFQDWAIISNL